MKVSGQGQTGGHTEQTDTCRHSNKHRHTEINVQMNGEIEKARQTGTLKIDTDTHRQRQTCSLQTDERKGARQR